MTLPMFFHIYRCYVCSWNVNILPPNNDDNLFPWLNLYKDEDPPDVLVIG